MLLCCLFNVKTQGPAVMDTPCSKQKRQIILSLRTAWILVWLFTTLTCYPADLQYISEHRIGKRQWKIDAEISVGTFCDNLSTAIWSKSVPTWDRSINPQLLTQWQQGQGCWETDSLNVMTLSYMQVSTHTVPARKLLSLHLWQYWNPTPAFDRHRITLID